MRHAQQLCSISRLSASFSSPIVCMLLHSSLKCFMLCSFSFPSSHLLPNSLYCCIFASSKCFSLLFLWTRIFFHEYVTETPTPLFNNKNTEIRHDLPESRHLAEYVSIIDVKVVITHGSSDAMPGDLNTTFPGVRPSHQLHIQAWRGK